MLVRDQAGDIRSFFYATPWFLVIKPEMFARDRMKLHICVARACLIVAVGLILIGEHAVASAFMTVSLCSAYTVLGIAWLASL